MGAFGCYVPEDTGLKSFLCEQFTGEGWVVKAAAIVKLTQFYAAVERTDKATGEKIVFAIASRFTYNGRTRELTYRTDDETVGPAIDECPAKILDLLTPTDSEWANEWRDRCRANLKRRATAKELRNGQHIRFKETLNFTDGHQGRDFLMWRASGRKIVFEAVKTFGSDTYATGRYTISSWRGREFEVIEEAK